MIAVYLASMVLFLIVAFFLLYEEQGYLTIGDILVVMALGVIPVVNTILLVVGTVYMFDNLKIFKKKIFIKKENK